MTGRSAGLAALLGAVACSGRAIEPPPRAPRGATEAPPPTAAMLPAPPLPSVAPAAAAAAAAPAASAPPAPSGAAAVPAPRPRCPEEMALVVRPQGPYCVDRWEASLVRVSPNGSETPWPANREVDSVEREVRAVSKAGTKPQGFISGEQAALACERAGKRLCEIDEWVRACRGAARTTYPYGDVRQRDVCNDRFKVLDKHPVVRLYRKENPNGDPQGMWDPRWMNDPRLYDYDHTLTLTGAKAQCTNELHTYDMVGNLHEWVADPEGTFFGGFFMDTFQNGEGCEYRTVFHPVDYHDYSTGFRCCGDPTWE